MGGDRGPSRGGADELSAGAVGGRSGGWLCADGAGGGTGRGGADLCVHGDGAGGAGRGAGADAGAAAAADRRAARSGASSCPGGVERDGCGLSAGCVRARAVRGAGRADAGCGRGGA